MSQTTEIPLTRLRSASDFISPADTIHPVSLAAAPPGEAEIAPILPPTADEQTLILSNGRTVIVIAALSAVNFLSSLSTGLLTIGLPRMALDIGLPEYLIAW
ncbi:hypothetical protein TrVFT333_010399 [Trichoderma virens FT-333]|nr:hypothetical protein TrVFT333_010399 [Trichoderma virens FT-333]